MTCLFLGISQAYDPEMQGTPLDSALNHSSPSIMDSSKFVVFLPSVSCVHSLSYNPTVTTLLYYFTGFLASPCLQAFPVLDPAARSVFPNHFVNVNSHSETFHWHDAAIEADVEEE